MGQGIDLSQDWDHSSKGISIVCPGGMEVGQMGHFKGASENQKSGGEREEVRTGCRVRQALLSLPYAGHLVTWCFQASVF